jgi:hypothetical protein
MSLTIAKALSKVISPLTGGITKELSGYLGDQIRFMRWKSAIHIVKRARLFCDEENLAPERIPIKFLVPFLEGASFEDVGSDQSIADMWSSLLGAAVTGYQARHAVYVDILKKLSTKEASYFRSLHSLIMKEDIYQDDGFDPDMWNSNDKQDQIDLFVSSFEREGGEILKMYREGEFIPTEPYDQLMNSLMGHCIRTDVIPLAYDLGFYQSEGWTNGIGSPFKRSEDHIDAIFNLVTLGLMEKFDVAAWHPKRHQVGKWAIRGTCSFAILTSLGFDFMKACMREELKSPRGKKPRRTSPAKKVSNPK